MPLPPNNQVFDTEEDAFGLMLILQADVSYATVVVHLKQIG